MKKRFQQILKTLQLLDSKKKVLLAVSGGVDSMVLFHLMQTLPPKKRPQLSIAHINHQLRPEADEEEQFVKSLAEQAEVPFFAHNWQVKDQPVTGIEEAARIERYRFFKEVMNTQEIDTLMTGHHLDDQVETVIMRLTRGASLEQLLGIQLQQQFPLNSKDGQLIRPLLHFSKEELYAYAKKTQVDFVEDMTNQELDFTRNRYRNEIIPLLKAENEQFNAHVDQFTMDLADRLEIADAPIQAAYEAAVERTNEKLELNLQRFKQNSPAMQRAIITQLLEELYEDEAERYKANYIDLVQEWLSEGAVNTALDLTGSYQVKKGYQTAIFTKKSNQEKAVSTIEEPPTVIVDTFDEWLQLSATESIGLFSTAKPVADDELLIAAEHLHLPLQIRHRKPGDRMTYKGLVGTKKLSDIFIDDKTPPAERDEAWLVEDSKGSILWLLGHRKMHLFTGAETDKMLYSLKYVKK